ncbi:HEAT repeat domain-containing protein [Aliikangiella coralliicola]|uniref:Tetratricopeptide repeat protein n=1 Tax=Aliikangiella coralliicola TaxID=2592383 RepID=A0A545UIR8_9GAMM|nr:HEAT repeat domain-containing protein [Aliikangiella coralliicola]TQV89359.1 tetratricopeptide repeat protein [Aliikangiella coralliicola]
MKQNDFRSVGNKMKVNCLKKYSHNNEVSVTKKLSLFLATALFSCSVLAASADRLYTKGQQQLDNKEWQEAQKTFSSLAKEENKKQDAALYWLAYAQFKNNQNRQALKTIKRLTNEHPKSRWKDDAGALKIEIQEKSGEVAEVDNDELKLYAIDSLMNSSSEKAPQILKKILKGNSSNKIKKRALFVLSQTNRQESFDIVAELAADNSNETLQKYAVETLGISGSKRALSLLQNIYPKVESDQVKRKILQSFMVAGSSDELVDIARTEQDAKLKRRAIKLIGVMSKSDVLMDMYKDKAFADYRKQIIKSLSVGRGYQSLVSIVKTEKDDELLTYSVEKLGHFNAKETGDILSNLYTQRDSAAVKKGIIKALFIQSNAKGLINVIKVEKDPDLKRRALKKLSVMDSDDAIDYFTKILDNED